MRHSCASLVLLFVVVAAGVVWRWSPVSGEGLLSCLLPLTEHSPRLRCDQDSRRHHHYHRTTNNAIGFLSLYISLSPTAVSSAPICLLCMLHRVGRSPPWSVLIDLLRCRVWRSLVDRLWCTVGLSDVCRSGQPDQTVNGLCCHPPDDIRLSLPLFVFHRCSWVMAMVMVTVDRLGRLLRSRRFRIVCSPVGCRSHAMPGA